MIVIALGAANQAGLPNRASRASRAGRAGRASSGERGERGGRGRRGGFSLVELLLVIAIISLLVSIALPSLSRAKDLARRAVCISNLHRLATAVQGYAATYDSSLPPDRLPYNADGTVYSNDYGRDKPRWQWFVIQGGMPVIEKSRYPTAAAFQAATEMSSDQFLCPALRDSKASDIRDGAYGYNHMYLGCGRPAVYVADTRYRPVNWPVSIDRVYNSSQTVVLADSRGAIDSPQMIVREHSYTLDPPRLAVSVGVSKFGPQDDPDDPLQHASIPSTLNNSPADSRHLDRANVAFMDGHVKSKPLEALGYKTDSGGVVIKNDPAGTNELWTGREQDEP